MATRSSPRTAFTLIELLVVVSIIVILVSILVPALSHAMYTASVAACSATQKGAGTGLILYTGNFKKAYPYRVGVRGIPARVDPNNPTVILETIQPTIVCTRKVKAAEVFDDRPVFDSYVTLDQFKDPLQPGDVDYHIGSDGPESHIWLGYQLWAGFGYNGGGGMFKYGDSLTWYGKDRHTGVDREMNFNVIVSCDDMFGESAMDTTDLFITGHQDKKNRLRELVLQKQAPSDSETYASFGPVMSTTIQTRASWVGKILETRGGRGAIDKNVMFTDGSVERYSNVAIDVTATTSVPTLGGEAESRMQCPPTYKEGNTTDTKTAAGGDWFVILPEGG